MLKFKDTFVAANTELPSVPEEQTRSWKQELIEAFEQDLSSGIQMIQSVIENASSEKLNHYLEQLSEFFEENPGLLATISPILQATMSAEQRKLLIELSEFKKQEQDFALMYS